MFKSKQPKPERYCMAHYIGSHSKLFLCNTAQNERGNYDCIAFKAVSHMNIPVHFDLINKNVSERYFKGEGTKFIMNTKPKVIVIAAVYGWIELTEFPIFSLNDIIVGHPGFIKYEEPLG